MQPTASFGSETARDVRGPAPDESPTRPALAAVVWGAIGYIHAMGAPAPLLWAAVALAAILGLGILELARDDTRWTGMLAAVLLATSPLLQTTWALPQGPGWDRVMLLKMLVIVCGLLLLGRLGAGLAESEDSPGV
jgi:hypothetical protein